MKSFDQLLDETKVSVQQPKRLSDLFQYTVQSETFMGKILIIDDSKPIRRLLEYILTRENYEVVSAQDGFEAIFWLSEGNRPDLIISDIEMPNFTGEEVISNLNNSGLFSDLPVIILTGIESQEIKENFLSQGVVGYLTKPFDPANLVQIVKDAISSSKTKS